MKSPTEKKKTHITIPSLKCNNSEIVCSPKDIANELNKYFVNVGPNLANKLSATNTSHEYFLRNRVESSFLFFPTTCLIFTLGL